MVNVQVWKSICPYCKEEIGTSIKKDDKKTDKIYDNHLKNCKEYKKQNEQLKEDVKFVKKLQAEGLSIDDIANLFCGDNIEKDILKVMKKFKINKEQLIEVIEGIEG